MSNLDSMGNGRSYIMTINYEIRPKGKAIEVNKYYKNSGEL